MIRKPMQRAWYTSPVASFLTASPTAILGELAANGTFDLVQTQRDAWLTEIAVLKQSLRGLTGTVAFEFSIPRMGRRIDVVLLAGGIVFALEFKVGAATFDESAVEQVWDYALDLKNFHEASHALPIVPILVATEALIAPEPRLIRDPDGVYRPLRVTRALLRDAIDLVLTTAAGPSIEAGLWLTAPYASPGTPTSASTARAGVSSTSAAAGGRTSTASRTAAISSTPTASS